MESKKMMYAGVLGAVLLSGFILLVYFGKRGEISNRADGVQPTVEHSQNEVQRGELQANEIACDSCPISTNSSLEDIHETGPGDYTDGDIDDVDGDSSLTMSPHLFN